jgi:hypothetical protein
MVDRGRGELAAHNGRAPVWEGRQKHDVLLRDRALDAAILWSGDRDWKAGILLKRFRGALPVARRYRRGFRCKLPTVAQKSERG